MYGQNPLSVWKWPRAMARTPKIGRKWAKSRSMTLNLGKQRVQIPQNRPKQGQIWFRTSLWTPKLAENGPNPGPGPSKCLKMAQIYGKNHQNRPEMGPNPMKQAENGPNLVPESSMRDLWNRGFTEPRIHGTTDLHFSLLTQVKTWEKGKSKPTK